MGNVVVLYPPLRRHKVFCLFVHSAVYFTVRLIFFFHLVSQREETHNPAVSLTGEVVRSRPRGGDREEIVSRPPFSAFQTNRPPQPNSPLPVLLPFLIKY